MNYIDQIVFRMFKTLTDEQKYDLLEKLTLENKELKEQLSICDVVSTYVRYLGEPTWGLSTNSHYKLLDYNDSRYKIKDDEGNIDWWCKKSFEKL